MSAITPSIRARLILYPGKRYSSRKPSTYMGPTSVVQGICQNPSIPGSRALFQATHRLQSIRRAEKDHIKGHRRDNSCPASQPHTSELAAEDRATLRSDPSAGPRGEPGWAGPFGPCLPCPLAVCSPPPRPSRGPLNAINLGGAGAEPPPQNQGPAITVIRSPAITVTTLIPLSDGPCPRPNADRQPAIPDRRSARPQPDTPPADDGRSSGASHESLSYTAMAIRDDRPAAWSPPAAGRTDHSPTGAGQAHHQWWKGSRPKTLGTLRRCRPADLSPPTREDTILASDFCNAGVEPPRGLARARWSIPGGGTVE